MESEKQEQIKRQIEYYLSDENLKGDEFFHNKIISDPSGFLPIEIFFECNKVKNAGWTKEEIVSALKKSEFLELDKNENKVRRKDNKPLPELDIALLKKKRAMAEKRQKKEKSEPTILMIESDKEAENIWKNIQEKFIELNPNLKVFYTRFKGMEGHFAVEPIDKSNLNDKGEISFTKNFELNKINFKVDFCKGEDYNNFMEEHGHHLEFCIKTEESKHKKVRRGDLTKLSKPVTLGGQIFVDIGHITGHLRKISKALPENEPFNKEDESFIRDLLEYHPDKEEILKGTDYFTYAEKDPHNYAKYYFAVGKDKRLDFVLGKCVQKISNIDKKKHK